jgi:peptide chain release factor 1
VALTNPEVVNDNRRFTEVSKEYRSLEKIVNGIMITRKYSMISNFIKKR